MLQTKTINEAILIVTIVMLVILISIVIIAKGNFGENLIDLRDDDNLNNTDDQNNVSSSLKNKLYEFLKSIELRCAKVLNTATYIGIFATVATIGITCLINIVSFKAPQIDVKVIDGHHWEWKYDHRTEQPDSLHYSIDEKGHFSNTHNGLPETWNFRIYNKENDVANDIIVKLDIDGVEYEFFPQPDDYDLENHIHGMGSYATISTNLGAIDPDQYIDIPEFPVEHTIIRNKGDSVNSKDLFDVSKSTKLRLTVYSNEGLIMEKTYVCECDNVMESKTNEVEEYRSEDDKSVLEYFIHLHKEQGDSAWIRIQGEERKLSRAIERSLFSLPNETLDNPHPDYDECLRLAEAHKEIPPVLYQDIYRVALEKLNVNNSTMRRFYHRKAVFYGRMYYISSIINGEMTTTMPVSVDEKIQMDIVCSEE